MSDQYQNPLTERYASSAMSYIFSSKYKFTTWRKLWHCLATAQQDAGFPISDEQLREMEDHIEDIDFEFATKKEEELRHDVMAHVHTFAEVAPKAAPIIHLGVTSAFVGDNTDLIQMKAGMELVREKLKWVISDLKDFSLKYKDMPTLAYTHFQPAQPTTVGKRACLWLQEFLIDLYDLEYLIEHTPFRGIKGTTGTQASFVQLFKDFDNHKERFDKIEKDIAGKFGFVKILKITGQTYTRKLDYRINSILSSIAQSAAKLANDLRLLSHKKEVEEPFESKQIGSSAMAYKRNPMRCERVGSLARYVMSLSDSTAYTASTQWFERTLDDSANKRIAIPQAFLGVDAILELLRNVVPGLIVNSKMVAKNLDEEVPFMVSENIMMEAVKRGGNRQDIHELIRTHSIRVAKQIKEGGENTLIGDLAADSELPLNGEELAKVIDQSELTGRSKEMVVEFIEEEVNPVLKDQKKNIAPPEIRV